MLGWRAFVALLLGHIELYGHNNPTQAAVFYQQVLVSQPQETLAELAQQGLERSLQSSSVTSQLELPQPKTARQPLPDMLRDPFLKDQPETSGARSAGATAGSNAIAMPWLESTSSEPTPLPEPTPQPTPQPAPEPSQEPTPAPTEILILAAELVPESTPETVITEEDPLQVLAG